MGFMINLSYFRFIHAKGNLAMFSDAEMPSGVLIDNTGCIFKKNRSHFFPAADSSWLYGCFKPFLIAN